MSRIHDALKKAERERAAASGQEFSPVATADVLQTPKAISPDLAGPDQESSPATVSVQEMFESHAEVEPSAPAANSPATAEYIRFEDLRKRCAKPDWHPDPNINVFVNAALSEHGAEQFRTLRSRLYQVRSTQTLRTVLVTSSVPAEGKTFVTVNLAHGIVRQPDRRALIIDADLRCPRVHSMLGAPSTPGLTDYLRGEADEMAIIQNGPEENLCMIPGGRMVTNPSELLSNGRLGALVAKLTPVFDWIIVDSPPCLPVADASILAGICDGVLLVVKAGSTPSAVGQRSRQELASRNVVGVVLNAVGEAHMYSTDYYRTYKYGYGRSGKEG